VVEDQEDLRGVLRDLLTGTGDTVWAGVGEVGIAKAKSDRPDLILMDIRCRSQMAIMQPVKSKLTPPSRPYRSSP